MVNRGTFTRHSQPIFTLQQSSYMMIAIFIVGLITTSLIALAAVVGAAFGISYELSYILNHLSSTQFLFMLILFYGLIRLVSLVWRKYVQRWTR